MENFEPYQIILLMIAVAYVAYLFGRASAGDGEGREERRLREAHDAERIFSALDASKQSEVDRLLVDGKIIAAVKQIRAASGLGLKDAKITADWRRAMLSVSR